MTQQEALKHLHKQLGGRKSSLEDDCTGDSDTCLVNECSVCAIRDCPDHDMFHYHHDGCPSCLTREEE